MMNVLIINLINYSNFNFNWLFKFTNGSLWMQPEVQGRIEKQLLGTLNR